MKIITDVTTYRRPLPAYREAKKISDIFDAIATAAPSDDLQDTLLELASTDALKFLAQSGNEYMETSGLIDAAMDALIYRLGTDAAHQLCGVE